MKTEWKNRVWRRIYCSEPGMSGDQIGLRCVPQSRLVVVLFSCCMCIASNIFLLHVTGSNSLIFASSQFTVWSSDQACTAILLFSSFLLTTYLCSLILSWRFLPVSPMYTASQSLHGTSYTNPCFLSSGVVFFTCVSQCLPWDDYCSYSKYEDPCGRNVFFSLSVSAMKVDKEYYYLST